MIILISALLTSLATINLKLWPFSIAGLSLLFNFLILPANRTYKTILTWGVVLYGIIYYWIIWPLIYTTNNIVIASLLTSAFILFCAQVPAISLLIANKFNNYFFSSLIISWVVIETLISFSNITFPWGLIGYSMLESPWISFAPYGGVYLVSFITLIIAMLISKIINKQLIFWNIIAILLIIFTALFLKTLPLQTKVNKQIKVDWVEIPGSKWQHTNILDTLLTNTDHQVDLVIWPEGALNWVYQSNSKHAQQLLSWVKQYNTPILTGTFNLTDALIYNSAVLISPTQSQWVNKRYLVPFGEYIPWQQFLQPLLTKLAIPMSNLTASYEQNIVTLNNLPLSIFICYEIIFPNWVWDNPSQAIITITDDHWFNSNLAVQEHLNIAKMRALETQKDLVFVNANGLSQIIQLDKNINNPQLLTFRSGFTIVAKYKMKIIYLILLSMILILIMNNYSNKAD